MWRSILFVPADRPERFEKALKSGADAICIDLEDGVPAAAKPTARENCKAAITRYSDDPRVLFRLSHPASDAGREDLEIFNGRHIGGLLVPKVEHPDEIAIVANAAHAHVPIVAIIESALGMTRAFEIAAMEDVRAISFGSADWAAETGGDMSWDTLLYPRSLLKHAATVARIPALDGAYLDVRDISGLEQQAAALRAMGFSGSIALHPDQVPAINAAFALSESEICRAQSIVDAFEKADHKTILVDGMMVDAPIYSAAKSLLRSMQD